MGRTIDVNTETMNGYEQLTALVEAIPRSPGNRAWKLRVGGLAAILEVEGVLDGLDPHDQRLAAGHIAGCLVWGTARGPFQTRADYLRRVRHDEHHDPEALAQAVARAGAVIEGF
jgi:hypothetical protein